MKLRPVPLCHRLIPDHTIFDVRSTEQGEVFLICDNCILPVVVKIFFAMINRFFFDAQHARSASVLLIQMNVISF